LPNPRLRRSPFACGSPTRRPTDATSMRLRRPPPPCFDRCPPQHRRRSENGCTKRLYRSIPARDTTSRPCA
jgi:hypothetical protein